MITRWMLYCMLVSSLLSVAALLLERGLRLRGDPVRWTWVCALLGSVVFAAVPWVRPAAAPEVEIAAAHTTVASAPAPSIQSPGPASRSASAAAPIPTLTGAARPIETSLQRPLLVGWVILSAAGLLLLGGTHRRLHRRRRSWRRVTVDGVPALVSRATGPAVIGLLRGAIVLPEWVLGLEVGRRRLVVAHEEEHLRAGDTRLLGLSLATLAAMPWNLPLWWQLRRLRHAMEMDCDARVLARFPDSRAYGALLVELGERAASHALPLAAFSESSSFLERRIRAMFDRKPKRWKPIAGGCALVGVLLIAVACEIPRPTMATPAPRSDERSIAPSGERRDEVMIAPELIDATFPKINEVAAALVRERYPEVFARGLPDGQAVWFAMDGQGDVRASWIGPSRAEPAVMSPAGCGTMALPCREAPLGSPQRRAAAAREEEFQRVQFRQHVPEMKIEWVLVSAARIAGGSHFQVMFASERSASHGPYNKAVGEHARAELRRDPIAFESSPLQPDAISPEERLVRERYPELYANGLSPDRAVWVAVDRWGVIRKSWIGPAGFLPADLASRPWPSSDELRRLAREHQDREAEYLRTQVPELGPMEVGHSGNLVRNWRYHVRVNWAVQRQERDTLVLALNGGDTLRLRVRSPAEAEPRSTPLTVCSDPAGGNDLGDIVWPGCGGYRLYGDGSVALPKVHPVMGRMVVGGPAWRAGLRSGDVLLTIDGRDTRTLLAPFKHHPGGKPYRVTVRRGAEERTLVFPVSWGG